ncbi:hypothetical protein KW800_02090, partial [Candidatus Parcubacteria bacterium]|nr:hypothetical protein [Candidatus Parcubacteria bacterium]
MADSGGNLLGGSSGTTYYFAFSIWDSSTVGAGNKLWPVSTSSVPTTVRSGVFTVNIGDTANGYPDTLDYTFSNPNVFLQVDVSSNGTSWETVSPRQQLTSAIFAQVAQSVVSASSTITNFTTQNSTSTSATTTNLYISGRASTTELRANTSIIGFLTSVFGTFGNLLLNGSSTLQNFTSQNATSSNLYISGLASTTDLRANTATIGSLLTANVTATNLISSALGGFGTRCLQTDNNGLISVAASGCGSGGSGGSSGGTFSTTTSQVAGQYVNYPNNNTDIVAIGNFATTTAPIYFDPNTSFAKVFNQYFASGSTTLQDFTARTSTTSAATTTNFAITSLVSKILKTGAGGSVVGAVAGTDYENPLTFAYPLSRSSNSVTLAFGTTTNNGYSGEQTFLASTTLQNFTGQKATTTAGTTTDFFATNLFATVGNIPRLSNLTSNGFIKTTGGNGTLSVDTSTYITSIGGGTNGQLAFFGGANTLVGVATSSASCGSGVTCSDFTVVGSVSPTFTIDQSFSPTWTGQHIFNASTTLQNFTAQNSTSTSATTTNLFVSGRASTTELRANTGIIGSLTSVLASLTNLFVSGSSTLQNFTAQNATTSQATTSSFSITSLASKLLKTGSDGSVVGATVGVDYQAAGSYALQATTLSVTGTTNQISVTGGTQDLSTNRTWALSLPSLVNIANSSSTVLSAGNAFFGTTATSSFNGAGDLSVVSSTTLQNFTAQNSTSTSATTTNLFVSGRASTTDLRANTASIGSLTVGSCIGCSSGMTFAFPFRTLGTGENATGTTLEFQNGFVSTASSTFGGPIRVSTITTNLSSTAGLTLGASDTPQILTIDTINNRVQTGIGAGSAAPVLFVFDTKNTAGDPPGVNGSMYYNSNTNTFRCYQDSAWQTCGGQATSTVTYTDLASSTDLYSTNATIGTLIANRITSGPINGQTISNTASFTGTLTATGGLTTLVNLLLTGSSTLQNFTAQNSTTTNATSTSLATTALCLSGDCRVAWPVASAGGFSFPFTTLGSGEQATSTTLALLSGLLSTASSTFTSSLLVLGSTTLQNFTAINATSTNATSTNLAATTFCLSGDCRSAWPVASAGGFAFPFTTLGTGENATTTTLSLQNGLLSLASSTIGGNTTGTGLTIRGGATTTDLLALGSTTLQNFTAKNATTTQATTTNFAISGVTSKILYAFPDGDVGALTVGTGL